MEEYLGRELSWLVWSYYPVIHMLDPDEKWHTSVIVTKQVDMKLTKKYRLKELELMYAEYLSKAFPFAFLDDLKQQSLVSFKSNTIFNDLSALTHMKGLRTLDLELYNDSLDALAGIPLERVKLGSYTGSLSVLRPITLELGIYNGDMSNMDASRLQVLKTRAYTGKYGRPTAANALREVIMHKYNSSDLAWLPSTMEKLNLPSFNGDAGRIKYLVNLQQLSMRSFKKTMPDLRALKGLKHLELWSYRGYLDFIPFGLEYLQMNSYQGKLRAIKANKGLKVLQMLDYNGSINELAGLPLIALHLDGKVPSISSLRHHITSGSLRVLRMFWFNDDLSPLAGCHVLRKLVLPCYQGPLDALRDKKYLRHLELDSFKGNLEPLSGCQLETVVMRRFDGDLRPIANKRLTRLVLNYYWGDITCLKDCPLRYLRTRRWRIG